MKTARLVAILFCFAISSTSGQNIADADAVKKVLALESAWNLAEKKKDSKAMDELLDSSLVYVDYDGTLMTKAQFLAAVKSTKTYPQQEVTESTTGFAFGNAIIVTGIYVATGLQNGRPYLRRGRFVDSWMLKNGRWVCVASQATPILH